LPLIYLCPFLRILTQKSSFYDAGRRKAQNEKPPENEPGYGPIRKCGILEWERSCPNHILEVIPTATGHFKSVPTFGPFRTPLETKRFGYFLNI
jgi:hypothetical protein